MLITVPSITRSLLIIAVALMLASVACLQSPEATKKALDDIQATMSDHMVAQATLTAHYIAAARKAGTSDEEINGVLSSIAEATVIDEFWISDENGAIVYTNIPGLDFAFPTDPEAQTQAAPFAVLLSGAESTVVQEFQPRTADQKVFKYVGVAGVDQPRIVQVGIFDPFREPPQK